MNREFLKHELYKLGMTEVRNDDVRSDAAVTAVIEKQLESVKSATYDVLYPENKARMLIPVDNSAGTGAEEITYRQWSAFGMAQIITNYADDLPLIDALVEEFTQKVKPLGAAYQYSIQDLRRSQMAGAMLDQRRATNARDSIEFRVEDIAANGAEDFGLIGISNNANVSLVTPTTGTWSGATAEQILAYMFKQDAALVTANKETLYPDTRILDITNYNLIANKRVTTTGDTHTTVLEAYLRTSPWIKNVYSWNKLALADEAGTGPRTIVYKRDPKVLTLEIPQEFEQFDPQAKNLAFQVPCHARIGGVIIYYPIGINYMDGI